MMMVMIEIVVTKYFRSRIMLSVTSLSLFLSPIFFLNHALDFSITGCTSNGAEELIQRQLLMQLTI